MRNERKHEVIRMLLYALSGMIVGGAVGGALLMKVVTEGDTRRAQAEAAAAERAAALTSAAPAETLPPETPAPLPETEPPAEAPPPPDAALLRSLTEPAVPLFTAEYCYTDSDCYETHSEFWGWRVPLSTDSVVITCDGTICMAVDADAIVYEIAPDTAQITVTLPEPEIVSHELDEDSIRYYDVKSALFRSPTLEDYTALIREIKARISDRVVHERDFGRKTLETAQTAIRSCLAAAPETAAYQVQFILPEPAAPAQTAPPVQEVPEEEPAQEESDLPAPEDAPLFPFWW